ncbi:unnamed protein product [Mortierella alpina]
MCHTVAGFLGYHDYSVLARVNKAFYSAFFPYLMRSVVIANTFKYFIHVESLYSDFTNRQKLPPPKILFKYGQHVYHLHLHFKETIDFCYFVKEDSDTKHYRLSTLSTFPGQIQTNLYLSLLEKCPNLGCLQISVTHSDRLPSDMPNDSGLEDEICGAVDRRIDSAALPVFEGTRDPKLCSGWQRGNVAAVDLLPKLREAEFFFEDKIRYRHGLKETMEDADKAEQAMADDQDEDDTSSQESGENSSGSGRARPPLGPLVGPCMFSCTDSLTYLRVPVMSVTVWETLQHPSTKDIYSWFFDAIGTLTRLQELHVQSIEPKEHGVAVVPFQLTVDSGIWRRKGLGELEVFGFEKVKRHRVGPPEINWMRMHRP